MGKVLSLLYGAGAGAALMYFFDRDMGDRRRAMVRDRFQRSRNQADDAIDTAVNDLRNRTRGLLAQGMTMLSTEEVDDRTLEDRIRSRLGFLTRHAGAIEVNVRDKTATLTGDILSAEVDHLVQSVTHMRGVNHVENNLRVHETGENIPQLQGEGWMPGQGRAGAQWTPSSRLLAGVGAAYLFLYGAGRGGLLGTISQMGGIILGARAIGNLDLARLTGMTPEGDAVRVRKSINIQAPVDEVYNIWSNFENFPTFMSNIEEIKDLGEGRSHWVVKGPAGAKVEFDAVMTENKPNELIAWETVAESQVKHHGQVRFKESQRTGTQLNVNMAYTPPAGVVGHAVANVFGVDPKSSMDEDLVRLKSLLEEGKTTSKGKKVTREQIPVTGQSGKSGRSETKEHSDVMEGGLIADTEPLPGETLTDQDQFGGEENQGGMDLEDPRLGT